MVRHAPQRQRVDPGREAGRPTIPRQRAERVEQDLLGHVLSVRPNDAAARAEGVDETAEAVDERALGVSITVSAAPGQFQVLFITPDQRSGQALGPSAEAEAEASAFKYCT